MGIYDKYLLPKIVHFTCAQNPTMRQRKKVVLLASGRVLEIGDFQLLGYGELLIRNEIKKAGYVTRPYL
jgi:hypothetical protein